MSEEKFINKIRKKSILGKNKYKHLAVIAASAMLLVAAGQIPTGSGQTVARSIGNKIADVFNITPFSDPEEDTPKNSPNTEKISATDTTVPEETTELEDTETTAPTPPPAPVTLSRIYGTYAKGFKTDYKLGEELNTSGMQITAVYSDGSEKNIPTEDCSIYVPKGFYKDAGVYKITVTYKDKTFFYNTTVYAEKESVILNSIYGTFPEGFNFTVPSVDDTDLSGITVTAVYSDGSEKNISTEDCEITVEKDFMGIENKALVTFTYEERSFSFILTEEVRENEEI